MKVTAKIISIDKEILVATRERFLKVRVELIQGKEVVDTKNFSYTYNTSKEDIIKDVKKTAKLFESEQAMMKQNQEADKLDKNASKIINDLGGKKIS